MPNSIFSVRLDANELAALGGEKTDNIFSVRLDANELANLLAKKEK